MHLTDKQYSKLTAIIGKKEVLDTLIGELSENIASKRDKAPRYDENFPDIHFITLKKYWEYRRNKGSPKTLNDRQSEFKKRLAELTQKFRLEDEMEAQSG